MLKSTFHLSASLLGFLFIASGVRSCPHSLSPIADRQGRTNGLGSPRWLQAISTTGTNSTTTDNDDQIQQAAQDEAKPWGAVIGSTLLINCASLVGVITMFPVARRFTACFSEKRAEIVVSSSAAGALLATALFLVLPEASAMLVEQETDEDGFEVSWKFGVAVLAGFLLPLTLGALFPRPEDHQCDERCVATDPGMTQDLTAGQSVNSCASCAEHEDSRTAEDQVSCVQSHHHCVEVSDKESNEVQSSSSECRQLPCNVLDCGNCAGNETDALACVPQQITRRINWPLCSAILVGDGFHNFADGIFVGTAFLLCSSSVAVTIMAVSIYHEIAQELADFIILTSHGGLAKPVALVLNFLSGLTVMIGGIIALGVDLSNETIGIILGIAGGVYIQIAACECLPRVFQLFESAKERFLSIFAFIVGAIPIGLVLLNHHHCGL